MTTEQKQTLTAIVFACIDKKIKLNIFPTWIYVYINETVIEANLNNKEELDSFLTSINEYYEPSEEELKQAKIKELEDELNKLKNN